MESYDNLLKAAENALVNLSEYYKKDGFKLIANECQIMAEIQKNRWESTQQQKINGEKPIIATANPYVGTITINEMKTAVVDDFLTFSLEQDPYVYKTWKEWKGLYAEWQENKTKSVQNKC